MSENYYDDWESQDEIDDYNFGSAERDDDWGCCFPEECCMPYPHMKDECHTAEMYEAYVADLIA